jgi:hypothetical protein
MAFIAVPFFILIFNMVPRVIRLKAPRFSGLRWITGLSGVYRGATRNGSLQ